MEQVQKTSITQLEGILGQFDRDTVSGAVSNLGLVAEKRVIPPEQMISMSIIKAAEMLKTGRTTKLEGSQGGLIGGLELLTPFMVDTREFGITLACDSQITLKSEKSATDTLSDFPGGLTGKQVQQVLNENMDNAAIASVEEDLTRQAKLVLCDEDCFRIPKNAMVATTTKAAARLVSTSSVEDVYKATSVASGTMVIQCKKRILV